MPDESKTYHFDGKPFAPAFLTDQMVAAGVPVLTVRVLGPQEVEVVTTPAAVDATVNAVAVAHIASQDPEASEDSTVRAAFQTLKSATTVPQVRNAQITINRWLYRRLSGKTIE